MMEKDERYVLLVLIPPVTLFFELAMSVRIVWYQNIFFDTEKCIYLRWISVS